MKLSQRSWLPFVTLALLALAATVTSIGHDFTYDDRGVIFENTRVHSMLHIPQLFGETYWPPRYGGDGYRPFVLLLFTLQWVAAVQHTCAQPGVTSRRHPGTQHQQIHDLGAPELRAVIGDERRVLVGFDRNQTRYW